MSASKRTRARITKTPGSPAALQIRRDAHGNVVRAGQRNVSRGSLRLRDSLRREQEGEREGEREREREAEGEGEQYREAEREREREREAERQVKRKGKG